MKNKRAKTQTSFIIFVVVITILVVGGYIIVRSMITQPTFKCFGTFLPSQPHLEDQARLTFPATAEQIQYTISASGRNNCTIWLQFHIASDEFENFQLSTIASELDNVPPDNDVLDYYLEQTEWELQENYFFGYGERDLVTQWIFIDTTQSDEWIVYIITNEEWL